MVELVRKNPAVALGVVLARLLQKDTEWCAPSSALPNPPEKPPKPNPLAHLKQAGGAGWAQQLLDWLVFCLNPGRSLCDPCIPFSGVCGVLKLCPAGTLLFQGRSVHGLSDLAPLDGAKCLCVTTEAVHAGAR